MKKFRAIIPPAHQPAADSYQFSPATTFGGLIYISGQIGLETDMSVPGDIATQTENCFRFIEEILLETGSDLSNILSLTSYHVGDLSEHLPIFADIKTRKLKMPHPAWTAVGVTQLAIEGIMVEVSAVACAGPDAQEPTSR